MSNPLRSALYRLEPLCPDCGFPLMKPDDQPWQEREVLTACGRCGQRFFALFVASNANFEVKTDE